MTDSASQTYTETPQILYVRLHNEIGRSAEDQDNSHPTGVVSLMFKGQTFPLPTMVVQSKWQTHKNVLINLNIETKDQQPSRSCGEVIQI